MNKYATITDFMNDLSTEKREQVEILRALITESHPGLEEHIKWNAPSYVLDGEDRITFNLQNKEGVVKLVLHMGATKAENKKGAPVMADESGMIGWQSDIRGVISFASLEDILQKQEQVGDIITRWLAIN